MKITLPQQSLNLLRQLLMTPGLAKKPDEVYRDGELLCVALPEIDLSWVMSEADKRTLSPAELKKYIAKDAAWAVKEVKFDLTEKQLERVKTNLTKVSELVDIPAGKFSFALFREFGFSGS